MSESQLKATVFDPQGRQLPIGKDVLRWLYLNSLDPLRKQIEK